MGTLGMEWNGKTCASLEFVPATADATFTLMDVTIGVNFHWERQENQTFGGALRLEVIDGKICAINILPVEDYLMSVISSEMSATAPLEFLKAHAVISRSWVMAQIAHKEKSEVKPITGNGLYVRWYDQTAHRHFDVCADDHCQRYQGISRIRNKAVAEAIEATRGMILADENGDICDARFAKCCGGMMEEFSACWADEQKPYLVAKPDIIDDERSKGISEAFCNTKDKRILGMVLNNYDQETTDFYRWTVHYTTGELSQLIRRKSGFDLGEITDLIPVERGRSHRIILLKIIGTKGTITVGKELEIRRWLSDSHLYSSAFDVEKTTDGFTLHGRGWGHGVGLCQIGAAVMADRGYSYTEILNHYYNNSQLIIHNS